MRMVLAVVIFLISLPALAQDLGPTSASPTPVPTAIRNWRVSTVPWAAWFKKNAIVTEKADHVHFFWNAQDFKANFEVKDKRRRLAEAALELVKDLYPKGAKNDLVKVDIVYVLERDTYGEPKWDSLQQVAHLECLRSKALKLAKGNGKLSDTEIRKIFDKIELF